MIVDLQNFIAKYKNTDYLRSAYCDFKFNWIEGIDDNIKKDVLTNLECVKNEFIYGDGDFDKENLEGLIVALEKMIEKMEN